MDNSMSKFKTGIIINKPIDIVVKAYLNPDNIIHWTKDLERFEIIKGTPGEVGSVARLHYIQKGRKYIMEDKLLECDPGEKYISQVSSDFLVARVETIFNSIDDKTGMSIKWEGTPKIFFLKIIFPFMKGKMTRQAQSELEIFKKLVESMGEISS